MRERDQQSAEPVTVIGAGWAGLAAAIRLVEAGRRVRLIDAAPQAGGRARELRLNWGDGSEIVVDNGQHLIIGAYRELLSLLDLIGVGRDAFVRRPMTLLRPDGFEMRQGRMPLDPAASLAGPRAQMRSLLALLRARGLDARDRIAILRALLTEEMRGWRAAQNVRVVPEWWRSRGQTEGAIRKLWQPLVVGTMNTAADQACAQTFLNVLRDTLGTRSGVGASDLLLPKCSLSALFVDPALAWLRDRGCEWRPRCAVREIARDKSAQALRLRCTEQGQDVDLHSSSIVIAVPPHAAARMLRPVADSSLLARLDAFDYEPITTAWCGWPITDERVSHLLDDPMVGLADDPDRECFGQWLFDRGIQHGWRVGGVVISDSSRALALGEARLRESIVTQLHAQWGLPAPRHLSLVTDKRATFRCTAGRPRLHALSMHDETLPIAMAGDHLWPEYPATLESALRSGREAARGILLRPPAAPVPAPARDDRPAG